MSTDRAPRAMRQWPKVVRASGLIERTCRHGIGHPDPESIHVMERLGPPGNRGTWGVHGCDGCCMPEGVSDGGT